MSPRVKRARNANDMRTRIVSPSISMYERLRGSPSSGSSHDHGFEYRIGRRVFIGASP